ncbi:hypothetical protein Plec18170_009126 [Paecilomyces lecythidis]
MRTSRYTPFSIYLFLLQLFYIYICAATSNLAPQSSASPHFNYTLNTFYLNGQPFQIIGGQMDPQRIPYQYWRQRLNKARSMGLNTIFSYVYWNLLEPRPGEWTATEPGNNIAQYFKIAQEEGLHVVVRPGPYICGEREWGGFPAWLSTIPSLEVRTNNTRFMSYANRYLEKLLAELKPLQATRGGPILMVQVENEYGSYGDNHNYTASLRDILRRNLDPGTILYTNDGGVQFTLEGGNVPGALAETDGDPSSGFQARNTYITDQSELGPLLDGEYYTLAPDQWGSNATHNDPNGDQDTIDGFVKDLEFVLGGNNSISLYMFHGGTNFGFGNGGIWRPENYLAAFTTSYDYGAPLDESGRTTSLYYTLRDVIQKYSPEGSIPDVVPDVPRSSIAEFALHPIGDLFDSLPRPTHSTKPVTMESLNQAYGFILYETTSNTSYSGLLKPGDRPRDRVLVYVNGEKQGVIDSIYESPAKINISLHAGDKLQILVENLGRVDYWSLESGTENELLQPWKGIVGDVVIGDDVLEGWDVYPLPLDPPPSTGQFKKRDDSQEGGNVKSNSSTLSKTPIFYSGRFRTPSSSTGNITDAAIAAMELDTFLSIPNGTKGVVWVNSFNLGRYWVIGPQQSLYLPGVLLNKDSDGWNEVLVLELEPEDGKIMVGRGSAERQWGNAPDPDAP